MLGENAQGSEIGGRPNYEELICTPGGDEFAGGRGSNGQDGGRMVHIGRSLRSGFASSGI